MWCQSNAAKIERVIKPRPKKICKLVVDIKVKASSSKKSARNSGRRSILSSELVIVKDVGKFDCAARPNAPSSAVKARLRRALQRCASYSLRPLEVLG